MSADRALPEGTVTFVFTDIEGSTRLLTALGARYQELLATHHAALRRNIAANGGTEVETQGDAFFIAFARPLDALQFAVDTQRELRATDFVLGSEVLVRIGIHTGEGKVSQGDYVGIDVHRAARVATAGHGGQVLLSSATAGLLAEPPLPDVRLRDLGEHRLKDLTSPVRIFELAIEGILSDFPPIRSKGKGNLPEELTSFVGREDEVRRVTELLHNARLVTLTGPGGTGKTRLSIEVARHVEETFTDGVWFVPLEEVTDPDLVAPAIARVVGVKEEATRPPIETLAQGLGQRHALIVLDNFEQVVGAAPHVNRLLRGAPALHILCSSREALRISGEQEFQVPPLDDEPAVRLFVQRARQLRPDFAPSDEDRAAIADICRLVDRLPLAIELAAARIRLFPPRTLRTRLSDRLGMLQGSQRDLPDRRRTLRGAIEWSWELLDAIEREVFARLAVFAGGADLAAIEAVVDPDAGVTPDVTATLGSLVEKSLVVAATGPGGDARYRMLETIRAFATEKLADSPEATALRDRHLAYFVRFAEAIEPQLNDFSAEATIARVETDHDNLRAAMSWAAQSGKPGGGLHIGGSIWRFWKHRGRLREGRDLLEALLAVPAATDPESRGRGLTGYGGVLYWQTEYPRAQQVYEEALALYREAGDERHEAQALFDLGFAMSVNREMEAALRTLANGEELYTRLGDEQGRLMVAEGRGLIALIARDLVLAREIYERVVDDYGRLGMHSRMVDTLGLLITTYLELGESGLAQARWTQWTAAWRELDDFSAHGVVFELGARLALLDGRPRDAAKLLGAQQQIRDLGEPFRRPSVVLGTRETEPDVRAALSAEEFEASFAEGRAWPRDEAIMIAIELGEPSRQ